MDTQDQSPQENTPDITPDLDKRDMEMSDESGEMMQAPSETECDILPDSLSGSERTLSIAAALLA